MDLEVVKPRWQQCVVAAPGPSLEAFDLKGWPLIVVQDAYKCYPDADVLYGCDPAWWESFKGDFSGELWSTHEPYPQNSPSAHAANDKGPAKERFPQLHAVRGARLNSVDSIFSRDPSLIYYGDNSGFQALNLAILFGCTNIVLIGFDLNGMNCWSGDRRTPPYGRYLKFYDYAAAQLTGVSVINASPNSALTCFPKMELADALIHNQAAA